MILDFVGSFEFASLEISFLKKKRRKEKKQ